jgi:23S rRNA pseudouridine1911/1915/1917 synthase
VKPPRRIVVSATDAGKRVDRLLAEQLALSRRYALRLLARERVRLGGKPARKGAILREGDEVEVLPFRHPREGPIAAPELPVTVLARSAGLVAVDKPAGRATHPLDFDERDTVLNGVLAAFPELLDVGEGGVLSGVVHRLDVQTSGVLLFATEQSAWETARAAFVERRVSKRYLARVHGRFEGALDSELRLDHRGAHMARVPSGGLEALTRLRALEPGDETSLVEAEPVTGVRHQIRVALAAVGHPIVGDRLYGSHDPRVRHLLHATHLQLPGISADSPAPPEILEGARSTA